MKVRLHLSIESDTGHVEEIKEVITLERKTTLTPDRPGLSLAESKQILHEVQQILVSHQTAAYVADQRKCPDCGAERKRKGTHDLVYRTLFGKFTVKSLRLYTCPCQKRETQSISPLVQVLQERTAPELVYLESKFAALMSYGLTVELLAEVLPFTRERSVATVHRNLQRLAERAVNKTNVLVINRTTECKQQVFPLRSPCRSNENFLFGRPDKPGSSDALVEILLESCSSIQSQLIVARVIGCG